MYPSRLDTASVKLIPGNLWVRNSEQRTALLLSTGRGEGAHTEVGTEAASFAQGRSKGANIFWDQYFLSFLKRIFVFN